ncbi:MAG: dihydrofolate reductase [Lachnospiraceae bacterium]|nr:dihydrofolate reductase [Lachnospiraceae bacterium]
MNLIVAVDENWAIGRNGDLLAHMKEDMKFFRATTKDHVVLMGRKTLDSFPGGNPLKNRTNIVLTANPDFQREGVIVVHSIEELLAEAKKYPAEELFVIGGGRVYKEMLPYCTKAYVTHVHKAFDDADTWFPNLSEDSEWKLTETGATFSQDDFTYTFTTYERVK